MELMRRLGQGRLSEIVPPRARRQRPDRHRPHHARARALPRARPRASMRCRPRHARMLEAYAAGVNAWLAARRPAVRPRAHPDQAAVRRPLPARAVAAGRFAGLGQADGARARRQLARRAVARCGWPGRSATDAHQVPDRPPGEGRDATLSLANEALNGLDLDRLYRATDNLATRKREASNEWVLSGAPFGVGQAAARQRPASRARLPRHLVSRAPGRAGLRHPRRHLARLAAASCSATTARSAGASPPPTSTARTCSSSGSIRPIPAATSRPTARARSACARRRSTCCGAIRCACACAAPVTAW